MRTRFRLPKQHWTTGDLSIKRVKTTGNHTVMTFRITALDGTSYSFEIKDTNIYHFANSIVDEIETFESTPHDG